MINFKRRVYMRGSLDEITWAFILIAIVLIIVAWALNPIYSSILAAQQNSARLNAQEIAGVINIMKTSSSDMVYKASLPAVTCKFEVNERLVKFDLSAGGKNHIAIMDIVQTPVKILSNQQYSCDRKTIIIEKQGGTVSVHVG